MFERTREFANAAAIDLQNASTWQKAVFAGGVLLVGSHLFGAETLYSNIGTDVFNDTDKANIALNMLATGAVLGATSAALETVSTTVVAGGVHAFPRSAGYLNKHYEQKANIDEEPKDEEQNNTESVAEVDTSSLLEINTSQKEDKGEAIEGDSVGEKVESGAFLLALGSPGRVLKHYTRDPSMNFKQRFKAGVPAINFLWKVNFAVGATVAGVTRAASHFSMAANKAILIGETPQYAPYVAPASGVFPILRDPLFWWSAFAGVHFMRKGLGNRKQEAVRTDLLINPVETEI